MPDHFGRIILSIGAEEYLFPLVENIDDDILVKLFLARNIVVQLRLGETGAMRNALRGCPRKTFFGKFVNRSSPYCAENAPPASENLVPSGQFGVTILVAVAHPYLPRLRWGYWPSFFLMSSPTPLFTKASVATLLMSSSSPLTIPALRASS